MNNGMVLTAVQEATIIKTRFGIYDSFVNSCFITSNVLNWLDKCDRCYMEVL